MQVNHDNLSVKEYGYGQSSAYKSTQGANEDFMSLLSQNNSENLNEQSIKLDELFSKAMSQDQFSTGIFSSNMSNIYNYRFRGQNETPMQANIEEKQEPQKDMVKDLLNSL
ncbi:MULTISPECIES: hypothetical protein [Campylobacter]|uniref:Uncharacterized protein n=1 Tax=Campylobacter lari TaxID=201 RepID=A0A5L4RRX4_CAMLA|nr:MULTISPECIES: hypothetical protein [Campylobacter]MCR8676996.1 hypothetical protein [Campylobacter sp. S4:11]MCR8708453.1 hypothetical protein [Campylobacter sp. RM5063]AJD02840.1 hypothetical protein UPTC4110_0255 [Campylobacter lari CCUG 22395]AJD05809.1 hypothetical protein UPTC16712_0264 [Campylobacter lari RM16712]EAI8624769.1 hypothetical protein [Campylobacter lari]